MSLECIELMFGASESSSTIDEGVKHFIRKEREERGSKADQAEMEEDEKKEKDKKDNQTGGELIGQGTYGCVFKPHILCSGETDVKDKEHVSKLIVMRRDDDYRLNEVEIGKILSESKKYGKYFSPIISTCQLNLKK